MRRVYNQVNMKNLCMQLIIMLVVAIHHLNSLFVVRSRFPKDCLCDIINTNGVNNLNWCRLPKGNANLLLLNY